MPVSFLNRRSRAGFSLVELLVVLVIIGILTVLATGAIQNAKRSAEITQSQSNLRQLAIATFAYVGENNGELLPHAIFDPQLQENREWCFAYGTGNSAQDALKGGILGPYLADAQKILKDPTLRVDDDIQKAFDNGWIVKPAYVAYGYNGFELSRKVDVINGHWQGWPLATIAHPSRTVMFATSGARYGKRVQPCENIWSISYNRTPTIRAVDGEKALVCWVDGSISRKDIGAPFSSTEPKLGHLLGDEVDGITENLFDRE